MEVYYISKVFRIFLRHCNIVGRYFNLYYNIRIYFNGIYMILLYHCHLENSIPHTKDLHNP
jgi:hypothetical protein